MKLLRAAVGIFIILCFTQTVFAGDEINFGTKKPTIEDITGVFAPEPEKKYSNTRGFKPAPKAVEKPIIVPKAISMEITFKKNSYQLTSKALETLDVVGEAFNTDKLSKINFTIEGHTDASGADSYNLKLSKQRAESVRNYLTKKHNVTMNRLSTVGKGEYELLDKENPYSGRNRRVKIISSGSN